MKKETAYKRFLDKKSDEQLIEILYFDKNKYDIYAIQEVRKIIKERGFTKEEIQATKRTIKKARRKAIRMKKRESVGIFSGIADSFLAECLTELLSGIFSNISIDL